MNEQERLAIRNQLHSSFPIIQAVIEGVMIAALAVGAASGYIYIRGEYRYLSVIMQKAIRDAYVRGFIGKNIFGSGRDLDIYWHGGAGAYEVGEESALMESLEGKRGIPRIRPPFPAVVGLWGGPTVINNAAGATSNFAADKLSTLEVKAVPVVVKTTGIVCAKSAFTAVAIGNTLSSFADRCAAARVRMEFAK